MRMSSFFISVCQDIRLSFLCRRAGLFCLNGLLLAVFALLVGCSDSDKKERNWLTEHADKATYQKEFDVYDAKIKQYHLESEQNSQVIEEDKVFLVSEWYNRRGRANWILGNMSDAEADFKKSLELYSNTAAKLNLGAVLRLKGDYKSAEKHYQEVLDKYPGNPYALWFLGWLEMMRGTRNANNELLASALSRIEKAKTGMPGELQYIPLYDLATVELLCNSPQSARTKLSEIPDTNVLNPVRLGKDIQLCIIAVKEGDYPKANKLLEKLEKFGFSYFEINALHGVINFNEKNFSSAKDCFDAASQLAINEKYPEYADQLQLYAIISQYRAGDSEGAQHKLAELRKKNDWMNWLGGIIAGEVSLERINKAIGNSDSTGNSAAKAMSLFCLIQKELMVNPDPEKIAQLKELCRKNCYPYSMASLILGEK